MKTVKAPHPSSGHYSAGIISNGMVYVSGQTSADPYTGKVTDQGIAAEMSVCLRRVEQILLSAGIDRTHVVICKIYITDITMWKEANDTYAAFFGEHCPARAVYESAHLHHGAHIEVEAVAELS